VGELAGAALGPAGLAGALGGALGLGGRPAQARGDLVGVDLDHRALVALGGLPGTRAQAADDHGAVALGQGVGGVLAELAPGDHTEERSLAVPPALPLAEARGHGDA